MFIYIILLLILIVLSIIVNKTKKIFKIENTFLIIAISLGITMLLSIPLGNVPDESAHFSRAYEVSEFNLTSIVDSKNKVIGRKLPKEIEITMNVDNSYKEINDGIKKNSGEREFIAFSNTALYSFVNYIPQATGIIIGKLIGASIVVQGYLGRLVNFIVWLLLIYLSIKIIPFGKEIIAFISLLPITLQEAVSLSADPIIYSVSIFFISYVLNLIYSKNSVEKKDYVVISLLCLMISLCKIVYLPLCLFIMLIPKDKFKNTKIKWIFITSLAAIIVLINLYWLNIASGYLSVLTNNPDIQKNYLLHNPLMIFVLIAKTIMYESDSILSGMFGKYLESFSIIVPFVFVFINMMIFGIICYEKYNNKDTVKKEFKYLTSFILLSIFILIHLSLYIQWTEPYYPYILGIQGRYYLPTLLLVPLLLLKTGNKYKVNKSEEKSNRLLFNYMIIQNAIAILLIIHTHM